MLRVLCALSVLAFTACSTPVPRYVYAPPGPVHVAVAPSDTAAVRQLCVEPDSVVARSKPCRLRGS